MSEGLEAPVQLLYLLTLLGFLAAGAYLVVRQVHIRLASLVDFQIVTLVCNAMPNGGSIVLQALLLAACS